MIPRAYPLHVGMSYSAKPWRLGTKKALVTKIRHQRLMLSCGVPQTRQSREVSMCQSARPR